MKENLRSVEEIVDSRLGFFEYNRMFVFGFDSSYVSEFCEDVNRILRYLKKISLYYGFGSDCAERVSITQVARYNKLRTLSQKVLSFSYDVIKQGKGSIDNTLKVIEYLEEMKAILSGLEIDDEDSSGIPCGTQGDEVKEIDAPKVDMDTLSIISIFPVDRMLYMNGQSLADFMSHLVTIESVIDRHIQVIDKRRESSHMLPDMIVFYQQMGRSFEQYVSQKNSAYFKIVSKNMVWSDSIRGISKTAYLVADEIDKYDDAKKSSLELSRLINRVKIEVSNLKDSLEQEMSSYAGVQDVDENPHSVNSSSKQNSNNQEAKGSEQNPVMINPSLSDQEKERKELMSNLIGNNSCDVLIVTALQIEKEAILRIMRHNRIEYEDMSVDDRQYYMFEVNSDKKGVKYRIALFCANNMGNLRSALATQKAILMLKPSHVILSGICGGIKDDNKLLGDVLIAEQILYYEMEKKNPLRVQKRQKVFPGDESLMIVAKTIEGGNWYNYADTLKTRPDARRNVHPSVYVGTVASGEKVIADQTWAEFFQENWSELIGVEMEGAGVSLAARECGLQGILLVKGICDWADESKNDVWQPYASEAAATFVLALLKSGLIPNGKASA